jgi:glycosyltransferase involved in cell wall biosynthesis
VGDGPEREKLQNMVKEHGLKGKVIFTGWRSDIPAILAASDIFVLPSYSEGLPIALLEAMAAGKACVVTDIGLPVNSGENALVVPAGDPESLARAVETLLIDEKLREKLGRNAREEVKRTYSWEKAVDGYMRIFNQLKI